MEPRTAYRPNGVTVESDARGFSDIGANDHVSALPPEGPGYRKQMSRAEAQERQRAMRDVGVPFVLEELGLEARVRDLPFADITLLMGIPGHMRPEVAQAMKLARTSADAVASGDFEIMLAGIEANDAVARAICIAGFIYPRLVPTDDDLDGTDDCWLVTEIPSADRMAYFQYINRTRRNEGAARDLARLSTFPGSGVAQTPTR
jgi:hypothetical protein